MLKNGWQRIKVEDIAEQRKSALATGPFGSAISSKFFQDTGVPVIRGSNLSQDTGCRLIDEDLAFVSEEKAEEFERSVARRGDLVFTCWGTIDQVGLIDERSKYERYIVSNKQMKFTPDSDKADSLFLYYFFSSRQIQSQILAEGIGSSVPGFNLGQLRNFLVLLPPLPEQRAIASILGALDDKIELNRRMNATLESLARAIFKSWFVDFDPVRINANKGNAGQMPASSAIPTTHDPKVLDLFPSTFQDSELGPVPEGWKAMPISEAVEINPRRTLVKGTIAKYLDMKNVPTQGHRPDEVIDREMKSGTKFINGDTLMARITPCLENGKTAFVDFLPEGEVGWGSTEFIVMRPRPPLPNEFGYFLARDPDVRLHAIQNMTGTSGRQRVAKECFDAYLIAVPNQEVANEFAHTIDPIMEMIRTASLESAELERARDALLPQLLSGELPVPATLTATEEALA